MQLARRWVCPEGIDNFYCALCDTYYEYRMLRSATTENGVEYDNSGSAFSKQFGYRNLKMREAPN
jgi:hypothetical protein